MKRKIAKGIVWVWAIVLCAVLAYVLATAPLINKAIVVMFIAAASLTWALIELSRPKGG